MRCLLWVVFRRKVTLMMHDNFRMVTWTNIDLSSLMSGAIHQKAVELKCSRYQWLMSLKIIHLELHPYLPGVNELRGIKNMNYQVFSMSFVNIKTVSYVYLIVAQWWHIVSYIWVFIGPGNGLVPVIPYANVDWASRNKIYKISNKIQPLSFNKTHVIFC